MNNKKELYLSPTNLVEELTKLQDTLRDREAQVLARRNEVKELLECQITMQAEIQRLLSLKYSPDCDINFGFEYQVKVDNVNKQIENMQQEERIAQCTFREEALKKVKTLQAAPEEYSIEKISEDINVISLASDDLAHKIDLEYDPIIQSSISKLEREPVTILEIPGAQPRDLTFKELQAMIEIMKENIKQHDQTITEGLQEIGVLQNRETSLDGSMSSSTTT